MFEISTRPNNYLNIYLITNIINDTYSLYQKIKAKNLYGYVNLS